MMIDGSQTPGGFTTPGPVKNITLNLLGDSLTPTTVNLLGEGKDVPTMVQNRHRQFAIRESAPSDALAEGQRGRLGGRLDHGQRGEYQRRR